MCRDYTIRIHVAVIAGFLFSIWTASAIYLISVGRYNFDYFTYWGYTLYGVYLGSVMIATAFNLSRFLLFVCTILHPLASGTSIMIAITISIIVSHEPDLIEIMFKDRPITSDLLAMTRNGDLMIHGFTVFGVLYISAAYFNVYIGQCLHNIYTHHSWTTKTLFGLWWIITPWFLIGIYTLSGHWGPSQYPTTIDPVTSFFVFSIFSVAIQIFSYIAPLVYYSKDDMIIATDFTYRPKKQQQQTPLYHTNNEKLVIY